MPSSPWCVCLSWEPHILESVFQIHQEAIYMERFAAFQSTVRKWGLTTSETLDSSLPRVISSCQHCFHTYPFKSTHSLLPLHSLSLISLWNSGFLGAKVRLAVEMFSGNFQNKNLPRPVAQWAWLPFWNQRGHWQKAGVNKNSVSQRINALLQEWRFLVGKCQARWVTALYPYSDWLWSSGSSVKEQI